MLKYIPNLITILRFALVPIVCLTAFYGFKNADIDLQIISCALLLLAIISDFLDGFLARILNAESEFGRCFDNIADKVLNITLICTLLSLQKIWIFPALIVVFREIFVSALREYAAISGRRIGVDMFGKIKTTFQFFGLFLILNTDIFIRYFGIDIYNFGNYIFYISAILSLLSCIIYILKYFSKNV